MEREKKTTEAGTPLVDSRYLIIIDTKGPYLVYGNPPLKQEFIVPDGSGEAWEYKDGISYRTDAEPYALCRCGASGNKPFCDGAHITADWDPELTAPHTPLLDEAETYDGTHIQVADNPRYCAHARFCMAKGTVWENIEHADREEYKQLTVRNSLLCPSGRLKIWDKDKEHFIEPPHTPSLSLIEDPQKNCSGPLWIKGGIPFQDSRHNNYEVRNRVTLCRCGASRNKPFCDGSHIENQFLDNQPGLSGEHEE